MRVREQLVCSVNHSLGTVTFTVAVLFGEGQPVRGCSTVCGCSGNEDIC